VPERFSHLFEHLPEALLILGEDGLIANANNAAAELYRCETAALVGRRLAELWAAGEKQALLDHLAELTERGDLVLTGRGRRLDGRLFAQEMRLAIDPAADTGWAFVVARDLTERQRLESGLAGLAGLARLHEQEGTLANIAASALKLSRRMLDADRAAICTFHGDEGVEWLASHRLEPLIEASAGLRPSQVTWLAQALRTGRPELIDRRRPGHARSPLSAIADQLGVAAFAVVPLHAGQELTGIVGMVWSADPPELAQDRDLLAAIGRLIGLALANVRLRDSLLARQQALDESEERYRSLFEEAPEAIVLQSTDGVVLDANRAACTIFGRRRKDILGLNTTEAWELSREARSRLRGQLRRRGRAHVRGRGLRPDGSTFPLILHIAVTMLRGEERLLIQVRDLTEQERMQGELLQAQKMEALGQLISGVAHELNNPLSAIIAFSQLLRGDERLPAELMRDADLLMQEADRTRRIVQNLLDFARQRPPERAPTSLKSLVERTLDLHAYALGAESITVDQHIPDDLPPIDVDPGQIQQVLLNLTLNAIQAIGSREGGGTITIRAGVVGDEAGRGRVRLSIEDDGPGVSASVRPRLFEPFFTTKPVGEGTGLGLPVSYGIVTAHGGRLWHEASGRPGATFVLELPAGSGEAQPAPATMGWKAPAAIQVGERPRARIMAVDDEPAVREMIERALTRAGYEAISADGGVAALQLISTESIDLLLVDHRMGDMDGTELYRRAIELRPEMRRRVVLMSGDTLNPELLEFATANGIRMLSKPFDVASLMVVVEDELSAARPSRA
jgi:PAS domain S-box-containing protein